MPEEAVIDSPTSTESSIPMVTSSTPYIEPTDPFSSKLSQVTDSQPQRREEPVKKVETDKVDQPSKEERARDGTGKFTAKENESAKVEEQEKPEATTSIKSDLLEKLSKGEEVDVPQKKSPADKPNPGEKGYQRWSEQEKALKDTRAELEAARRELDETRGKIPADYEDIRKANEEYTRERQARDVTTRPEFQQNIVQPIKRNFDSILKTGKELQLDEYRLRAAIDEPDDLKRSTMLHNLLSSLDEPPAAMNSIVAQMNLRAEQIHALRVEGDEIVKAAPDVLASLQENELRQKSEEKQKRKEAYNKASSFAMQLLEDDEHGIDQMKDPKIKQAAQEAVQSDWDDLKPGGKALAVIGGRILHMVANKAKDDAVAHKTAMEAKDREVASLKLQLQKMSGATPSPSTAPASNGAPVSSSRDPFGDKVKKGL